MKKQELIIAQVSEKELKELAGGAESTPNGTPATIIPVSLAICPTTRCASIVESCNG
ncbi:class II lanthipeptide, LchA2/BrtA2 family [Paenibacillus wulumuqiensis]|uniref:class II lanthipeptide, LchA2/BrtA2 family n=1 Tax=Paenibacillus wulumuqiensis TaxID=1567107 RepID=UPI000AA98FDA|nr:class II lanthipeptide, LchA2/BrtA2 family [Paenibacillus wulumuqiensis]